jgi:hypothetical protein
MMDDSPKTGQVRAGLWGLCASCAHAIVITSDRGSVFVQCALAKTDPRFPRYPPVPVVACPGYQPVARPDR